LLLAAEGQALLLPLVAQLVQVAVEVQVGLFMLLRKV
jgi:hypothetical protein